MDTITWTTGNGKTAAVTVTLQLTETDSHYCDGHRTEATKSCCKIVTVATVDGMGQVGTDYHRVANHPQGIAAKCGKLGIVEANAARIDAAIATLKASPEWTAELDRIAKVRAEQDAYDAATAKLDRTMGAGWSY